MCVLCGSIGPSWPADPSAPHVRPLATSRFPSSMTPYFMFARTTTPRLPSMRKTHEGAIWCRSATGPQSPRCGCRARPISSSGSRIGVSASWRQPGVCQLHLGSHREIRKNGGDECFRDRADLEQRVLVRSPTRSFCGFTEAFDDGLIAVDQTKRWIECLLMIRCTGVRASSPSSARARCVSFT